MCFFFELVNQRRGVLVDRTYIISNDELRKWLFTVQASFFITAPATTTRTQPKISEKFEFLHEYSSISITLFVNH